MPCRFSPQATKTCPALRLSGTKNLHFAKAPFPRFSANEILKNISSLSWWFGVVFVGLLVSLLASYIKPRLDNWIAGFSESRRNKNKEEAQKWNDEVNEIRDSEGKKIIKAAQLSHLHGKAIFIMLMGVSIFLMIGYITQLSIHADTEKANELLSTIESINSSKLVVLFQLVAHLVGTLSFLLGFLYFKQAEKIHRQIEESRKHAENMGSKNMQKHGVRSRIKNSRF